MYLRKAGKQICWNIDQNNNIRIQVQFIKQKQIAIFPYLLHVFFRFDNIKANIFCMTSIWMKTT